MKIFISWSGPEALEIASYIKDCLERVLQRCEPWLSSENIRAGERWNDEINKNLNDSNFGIIILTPKNTQSSWIMFEAGAIAKSIDKGRVVPLLFNDLKSSNIPEGPLLQFQSIVFTEEGFRKLVLDINSLQEPNMQVQTKHLDVLIKQSWADLSTKVASVRFTDDTAEKRSNEEMITELVHVIRKLDKRTALLKVADAIPFSTGMFGDTGPSAQPYLDHFIMVMNNKIEAGGDPDEVARLMLDILPVEYTPFIDQFRYSIQMERAQASKYVGDI